MDMRKRDKLWREKKEGESWMGMQRERERERERLEETKKSEDVNFEVF